LRNQGSWEAEAEAEEAAAHQTQMWVLSQICPVVEVVEVAAAAVEAEAEVEVEVEVLLRFQQPRMM